MGGWGWGVGRKGGPLRLSEGVWGVLSLLTVSRAPHPELVPRGPRMGRAAYVLHGSEVTGAGGFFCVLQEACRRGARVYPEGDGSGLVLTFFSSVLSPRPGI